MVVLDKCECFDDIHVTVMVTYMSCTCQWCHTCYCCVHSSYSIKHILWDTLSIFKITTANGWKFLSNTNLYFSFRSDPEIVWIHGGLVTNLEVHNHRMTRVHNSEIESSNWVLWNTITISSTQKFNTMKISVYVTGFAKRGLIHAIINI